MDSKNVIAAISLSAAVIILYGLFFAPEPQPINQTLQEKNNIVENSEAPKLIDTQEINTISRDEAINNSDRISFENENIIGSISLSNGGAIDDFTFKNYNEKLNGKEKIISFYAKNARGAMARFIIQNRLVNVEDLKKFNLDGYSYNVEKSKEGKFVFLR